MGSRGVRSTEGPPEKPRRSMIFVLSGRATESGSALLAVALLRLAEPRFADATRT